MEIKKLLDEGLNREFQVTIPSAEIDKTVDLKLQEIVPEVKIPGFRPGKVPLQVVRQRYGENAHRDALSQIINTSSDNVMKQYNLRPALAPQYKMAPYKEGDDLSYTLTFEVLPEIAAIEVSDISLERFFVKADDSKVQIALEKIAEDYRSTEPIKPRAAKKGDIVLIDFKCLVDGKEIESGTASDYELELGSGAFIEGFEDQLIGVQPNEHKTLNLKFPQEYSAEFLAGKDAVFEVFLKEIHKAVPAKLDDSLAKKVGFSNFKDLENAVRGKINQEYQSLARDYLKQQILDILADRYHFPVPKGMVDLEFKSICTHLESGVEKSKLEAYRKENAEAWSKEYLPIAERRVRLGLILAEIANRQHIQVTSKELNDSILERAHKFPGQEARVIEYFRNNREALASVRAPILEEKVIDYLISKIKLKEKEITAEELLELVRDDEEDVFPTEKSNKKPKASKKKES
jgi:trigger factor